MTGLRALPFIRRIAQSGKWLRRPASEPALPGHGRRFTSAVTWSQSELRATVLPAQYLDDNSVHEQMARLAAARFAAVVAGPARRSTPPTGRISHRRPPLCLALSVT